MKHLIPKLILLCVAVCAGLTFIGPAGCISASKDTVDSLQFPPTLLAWPAVEVDYLRGIDDGVDDGDLTVPGADALRTFGDHLGTALDEHDVDALRLISWRLSMRPWADRGIADKLSDEEIGLTVAQELTEQVNNFTALIQSLQSSN